MTGPPLLRVAGCVTCRRDTRQRLRGSSNGRHPRADHYVCLGCGGEVLSLADLTDALGLAYNVAKRARGGVIDHGDVKSGEPDDLVSHLQMAVWAAWVEWDPSRCSTFTAYAFTVASREASNWDRDRRGRVDQGRAPKALAVAVSLDEPVQLDADGGATRGDQLPPSERRGAVDTDPHSLADLRREVSRRRGGLAEQDRKVGRVAAA